MILQALLDVAVTLLKFVVSVFPQVDTSIVELINSQFSIFKTALNTANFFIDIPALMILLGLAFSIESLLLLYRITAWVLHNLTGGIFKK